MEERLATRWARLLEEGPASMFRHGLVDTEPIGISMHRNRPILHGVTQPFWIFTVAVLRRGLEVPIRITVAHMARCTCSPQQTLTRSLWRCWKALNRWVSNDSGIGWKNGGRGGRVRIYLRKSAPRKKKVE